MSEPRRLKDDPPGELARQLLEAVRADRPEAGACARALTAMGLAATGGAGVAGLAGGSATAKAASAGGMAASGAGAGAGAGSSLGLSTKVGGSLLLKWITVAVVSGAAVAGAAHEIGRHTTFTSQVPGGVSAPATIAPRGSVAAVWPVSPVTPVTPPLAAAPLAVAPVTEPARAVRTSPAPVSAPAAASARSLPPDVRIEATGPSRATPPASASAPGGSPVGAQLSALRDARAALRAHHPEGALALLDDFLRRYPSSALEEETLVLRIDALVDAGRRDEARPLSDALLRAHPNSAYRQHVLSKIDSIDQK